MKAKYAEWTMKYLVREGGAKGVIGMCYWACEEMKRAFPELRLTWGWIRDGKNDGPYSHYWLVAPDGQIVDPTACQFDGGISMYEEGNKEEEDRLRNENRTL